MGYVNTTAEIDIATLEQVLEMLAYGTCGPAIELLADAVDAYYESLEEIKE